MTKVTQAPSAPVNGLVTLTAALPVEVTGSLGTVGTVAYSVVLAEGTLVSLPTLQSAENKTFVFTATNNKVSQVFVTILAESGSFAAVAGLAPNSVVIDNPPPGLLVGAQVQPVAAPLADGTAMVPAKTGQKPGAPSTEPGTGAPGQGQSKRPSGTPVTPQAAQGGQ